MANVKDKDGKVIDKKTTGAVPSAKGLKNLITDAVGVTKKGLESTGATVSSGSGSGGGTSTGGSTTHTGSGGNTHGGGGGSSGGRTRVDGGEGKSVSTHGDGLGGTSASGRYNGGGSTTHTGSSGNTHGGGGGSVPGNEKTSGKKGAGRYSAGDSRHTTSAGRIASGKGGSLGRGGVDFSSSGYQTTAAKNFGKLKEKTFTNAEKEEAARAVAGLSVKNQSAYESAKEKVQFNSEHFGERSKENARLLKEAQENGKKQVSVGNAVNAVKKAYEGMKDLYENQFLPAGREGLQGVDWTDEKARQEAVKDIDIDDNAVFVVGDVAFTLKEIQAKYGADIARKIMLDVERDRNGSTEKTDGVPRATDTEYAHQPETNWGTLLQSATDKILAGDFDSDGERKAAYSQYHTVIDRYADDVLRTGDTAALDEMISETGDRIDEIKAMGTNVTVGTNGRTDAVAAKEEINDRKDKLSFLEQEYKDLKTIKTNVETAYLVDEASRNFDTWIFEGLYDLKSGRSGENTSKVLAALNNFNGAYYDSQTDSADTAINKATALLHNKGYTDDDISLYMNYIQDQKTQESVDSYVQWIKNNGALGVAAAWGAEVGSSLYRGIWRVAENLGGYGNGDPSNAKIVTDTIKAGMSTVTESIKKAEQEKHPGKTGEFMGNALAYLYEVSASGVESTVMKIASGGASIGFMALTAGVDAYDEALERGLDSGNAMVVGTMSGIFEALFEELSLEKINWFKEAKLGGKLGWVELLAKSGFTEGMEEITTDIANATFDYFYAGNFSELSEAKYNGMTATEYGLQKGKEILLDGLAGALMGSMANAGNVATNIVTGKFSQTASNRAAGAAVTAEGDVKALVEEGKDSGDKTIVKLAENVEERAAEGKDVTKQSGELYNALQNKDVGDAVYARAKELGQNDRDAKNTAKGITAAFNGTQTTDPAAASAMDTDVAKQIWREMSGEDTTGWTKEAGLKYYERSVTGGVAQDPLAKGRRNDSRITQGRTEINEAVRDNKSYALIKDGYKGHYGGENGAEATIHGITGKNESGQILVAVDYDAKTGTYAELPLVENGGDGTVSIDEANAGELYDLIGMMMNGQEIPGTFGTVYKTDGDVPMSVNAANDMLYVYNSAVNRDAAGFAAWYYNAYKAGVRGMSWDGYLDMTGAEGDRARGSFLSMKQLEEAFRSGQTEFSPQPGVTRIGTKKLTASQRARLTLLDEVLRKHGIAAIAVDTMADKNGYVSDRADVIVFSLDASEGLFEVAGFHEIVHLVRSELGDRVGDAFVNGVIAEMIDDRGQQAYDDAYAQREQKYADDLERMKTPEARKAYIDEEIAAQYMGTIAADNMENLVRRWDKEPGLLTKIWEGLKQFLADIREALNRLAGLDVTSREALAADEAHVERLLEMFENAMEMTREQREKNLAQQGETLRSQAEKGELGERSAERKSYKGEKGATEQELVRLADAKKRIADGESSEQVRRETGWFQGYDGKWRLEIDDSKMRFDLAGTLMRNPDVRRYNELMQKFLYDMPTADEIAEIKSIEQNIKGVNLKPQMLGDMMDHSALFAAYPELEDIRVKFMASDEFGGRYHADDNLIEINEKYLKDTKKLTETLMHEVQHAIQNIEGFSTGASALYWAERVSPEELRKKAETEIREILQGLPKELQNKYDRYNELDRVLTDLLFADETDEVKYAHYEAIQDELYEELYQYDWFKQLQYAESILRDPGSAYHSLYTRTAGEIEARDVANRLNLTAGERQNTRPDIDRTDVVFANGGVSYSHISDVRSWDISWDSDNFSSIKKQLRDHLDEVNEMEPVTSVQYDAKKGNYKELLDKVLKERFGYKITRKEYGTITFDDTAISKSSNYVNNDEEAAAIIASPYVLKRGKAISGHLNHKEKGNPSVTFAAPATLNGKVGNVAVAVLYGAKDRVHAIRVLTPTGAEFELVEIKEAELTAGGSVTSNVSTPISSAKTTIPQPTAGSQEGNGEKITEQKTFSMKTPVEMTREEKIDSMRDRRNQLYRELKTLNAKVNELKTTEEYQKVFDALFESKGDEGVAEYIKWQEESGLNDLEEQRERISKEREDLANQIEILQNEEGLQKEQEAIEKSGKTEEDYFRSQAVKEFGYTPYFYDAGYLLPNGKMLNFSGEKGRHFGSRGQDHRAVGVIFENEIGSDAMIRFMNQGNIRVMAETPGVDLYSGTEPTAKQYAVIRQMVREYADEGYFSVDFTDEDGNNAGSLEYENSVNADRVINDIKHFYATGEIRGQSDVERFRYSRRLESVEEKFERKVLENAALKEQLEETKKLLRNAQKELGSAAFDAWIADRETGGRVPLYEDALKVVAKYNDETLTGVSNEVLTERIVRALVAMGDKAYAPDVLVETIWQTMYDKAAARTETEENEYRDAIRERMGGRRYWIDDKSFANLVDSYGSRGALNAVLKDVYGFTLMPQSEAERKTEKGRARGAKDVEIYSFESDMGEVLKDYPNIFSGSMAEELAADGDPFSMAYALLELQDSMTGKEYTAEEVYGAETLYEGAMDEAARFAEDIIRLTPVRTVADEYVARMDELREQHKGELAQREKRITELEQDLQSERVEGILRSQDYENELAEQKKSSEERLAAQKKYYAEMRHRQAEKRKDTASRKRGRDRIRQKVRWLNDRMTMSKDGDFIPEKMRGGIAAFIKNFLDEETTAKGNTSVFTEAQLDRLYRYYNSLQTGEDGSDSFFDEDIMAVIDRMGNADDPLSLIGKRLADLTKEQLNVIEDVVDNLIANVRNANKAFGYANSMRLSASADRLIQHVDEKKKDSGFSAMWQNFKTGKLNINMIKPIWLFKDVIGGEMERYFTDLQRARTTWAFRTSEARQFFAETKEKYHYKDWKKEDHTFTLDDGSVVNLTKDAVLQIYATWKRERSSITPTAHLTEGGIVLSDDLQNLQKKTRKMDAAARKAVDDGNAKLIDKRAHRLTLDDINTMLKTLTDDQKKYADAVVAYMSTTVAGWGNEMSRELSGYDKFKEGYYFPYQVSDLYLYHQMGVRDETRLKNAGFTKALTANATKPIVLTGFSEVAGKHVIDMANYSTLTGPLENLNRLFSYYNRDTNRSVQDALTDAFGSNVNQYISNFLNQMNGGVKRDNVGGFGMKLFSGFKRSAVAANISVVAQQPSAVARAMYMVNPKYFVETTAQWFDWKELQKWSGTAMIKAMGSWDINTGKSTVDYILGESSKMDKFNEWTGKGAEWADAGTWSHIWNAVKRETADRMGIKYSRHGMSEEFYRAAAERFDEVVDYTQVYDATITRSQWMRSDNGYAQMVTQFMAEPTTSYNMLVFSGSKVEGVHGSKGAAIAALVCNVLLNTALQSLAKAWRKKGDEPWWERYVNSFLEGIVGTKENWHLDSELFPLNLIPFVKDIIQLFQGWDVERSDMQLISDLVNSFNKLREKFADRDDDEALWEFMTANGDLIANFIVSAFNFVIPAKTVYRDFYLAPKNAWKRFEDAGYDVKEYFFGSDSSTTWQHIGNTLKQLWEGEWDANEQLYNAILQGDTAALEKYTKVTDEDIQKYVNEANDEFSAKAHAESVKEKSYHNKVQEALKQMDSRVEEAARALLDYDFETAERLKEAIMADGFDRDDVVRAITETRDKLEPEKAYNDKETSTPYFADYDMMRQAYYAGNPENAQAVRDALHEAGKTDKQIDEEIQKSINADFKNGEISLEEARQAYKDYTTFSDNKINEKLINQVENLYANDPDMTYDDAKQMYIDLGLSEEKAGTKVGSLVTADYENNRVESREQAVSDYMKYTGETDAAIASIKFDYDDLKAKNDKFPLSYDQYNTYVTKGIESAGISVDDYAAYTAVLSDKDENSANEAETAFKNGQKKFGIVQAQVLPYIDSMDLTSEQKDALFLSKWSSKNLDYTPWHNPGYWAGLLD